MITILKVRSGSRAYGLATPESDYDSRGVCLPDKRFILGLTPFEQWEDEKGDNVLYGIHKFVRLALEGNPNIIELLFSEEILEIRPEGEKLRALRQSFLSKKVGDRFGQYALHQLKRIENHRRWWDEAPPCPRLEDFHGRMDGTGRAHFESPQHKRAFETATKQWNHYQRWQRERNPARAQLEEKFGYDTKHAMHLCRLLTMGIEILREGEVIVWRPDAAWLSSVRRGALSYEQLLEWARQREAELKLAQRDSRLPDEPDRPKVEEALMEIVEGFYWGSSSSPVC